MQGNKRFAELELPAQLWGSNLPSMFASFGLEASLLSGSRWKVRTATPGGRYEDLIFSRTLAGPTRKNPQFEVTANVVDPLPAGQPEPAVKAVIARLRASAQASGKALDHLKVLQAELMVAPAARCGELAEQTFDNLGSWGDPADQTRWFPQRSVHLVSQSEAVYRRIRLPSIVLRIDQDPGLASELAAGAARMPQTGAFASASAQSNSLGLAGAYLGPLMGCLLPNVWAYSSRRPLSAFIFGLGRGLPGAVGEAQGLLPLLSLPTGNSDAAERVSISAGATEAAIDWWVLKLNQMFRYLTDPATYVDSKGLYAPHEQLHWMLTFDQVFQLTASIQAAGLNDTVSQRILAYTLLGSYADRIFSRRVTHKKLYTLNFARNNFDLAKNSMSAAAGEVLLPMAQRALDALEEVQKGFFITSQTGAREVELQLPGRAPKPLSLEQAAARLMVIHRNATHGYGGVVKPDNKEELEISERLLAHHDGNIPDDIALLPYLYLLASLSQPDVIEKRIIDNVAKL
ncbi:hypothetical protein [Nocardia salmonicida]|uniref:hypothetical protein n=1 Tax=Nocardia salmonicida TaxID=53431 RepID=UPI0037997E13